MRRPNRNSHVVAYRHLRHPRELTCIPLFAIASLVLIYIDAKRCRHVIHASLRLNRLRRGGLAVVVSHA